MNIITTFSDYTQRMFGFKPRKQQIRAAKLLAHKESLVHMNTGEGKTVVAALAALMAVQSGRRVYIVTVNDYLAKRDMEAFSDLFLSLGYAVTLNTQDGDKNTIHAGNIIYTSVQNLLFDYVSNEFKPDGIPFNLDMAILDEIDYILLDSANTRYSVSMGDGCFKQDSMLMDAVWHYSETVAESDITVEIPRKRITLEDSVYIGIENAFSITPNNPKYADVMYLCHTALLARYCYIKDVDYLVESDGILSIVNQYNGRACRNSYFEHELDYFLRKKENIRFAGMAGGQCKLSSPAALLTNQYTADEQMLLDNAGKPGNVLVSTNMVGRGADIIADAENGLCVIITRKSEEARVDIQARGRSGRNGAKGLTITLNSDEDEQYISGSDLEAQRTISLCEDIIFENAKLSLI